MNQLQVGFGEAGQRIGQVTRFVTVSPSTLGGQQSNPEPLATRLEELGNSFNLGKTSIAARTSFKAGKLLDSEMFLAVDASDHEASSECSHTPP